MAKLGNLYLDGKFPISTNRLNHFDRLFGQALFGGVEKSVDYAPIISVSDALAKPAIDLQCKITAVQEGSGDPSPQNIRNIVGWNGLTLHVNSSEIPVTWQTEAGTVYGGVVDLTTGVLTVTYGIVDMTTLDYQYIQLLADDGIYPVKPNNYDYANTNIMCNMLATSIAGNWSNIPDNSIRVIANQNSIRVRIVGCTTVEALKTALAGAVLVYPLATPQTYTLTPQAVQLLAGNNTLWNTAGDTALTYLAKKS